MIIYKVFKESNCVVIMVYNFSCLINVLDIISDSVDIFSFSTLVGVRAENPQVSQTLQT